MSLYLGNINVDFLFQVVKKAALTTSLLAGVGAALIGLRILKKDLKLFWENHHFLINSAHFNLRVGTDQYKVLVNNVLVVNFLNHTLFEGSRYLLPWKEKTLSVSNHYRIIYKH